MASTDSPEPALKCVAWCPGVNDDAREYGGSDPRGVLASVLSLQTVKEIAEQHAEYLYYEHHALCDPYEVRVRVTRGSLTREWDVTVDVEVLTSFSGHVCSPCKETREAALPAETVEPPP